jgi:SnoaL-like domain
LVALYSPDAINDQVAESAVVGRDAIRETFSRDFAAAEMMCMVEQIFQDGDWTTLEWRDPEGLRGCGFFHVVDGKIVFSAGEYWDKLSLLRLWRLPMPASMQSQSVTCRISVKSATLAWAFPERHSKAKTIYRRPLPIDTLTSRFL